MKKKRKTKLATITWVRSRLATSSPTDDELAAKPLISPRLLQRRRRMDTTKWMMMMTTLISMLKKMIATMM
jgi:hypothetical protein